MPTRVKAQISLLSVLAAVLFATGKLLAQSTSTSDEQSDLRAVVRELQAELKQTRRELARAEQRIDSLGQQVSQLHKPRIQSPETPDIDTYTSAADVSKASAEPAEDKSEESAAATDPSLLLAQVEEQQQTKVESASKYRVKLSGLILMNAFSNRGSVDIQDIPSRAFNSKGPGAIGATVRQSIIGLQVIGPQIGGARTSGSVSIDLAGGFPERPYGTTSGILRLREAKMNFEWPNSSLMIGQEAPAIAPLSPTSFATVAEPAFSWAGNLWVWTPQVILSHKFRTSDSSYFSVGGGLALPITEEAPLTSQFTTPGPGELSRRPAFEVVAGWHSTRFGQPLTIGLGGYLSRYKYDFGRNANGWAGTAFWEVPITSYLQWSGEAFRGEAIGGLAGAIWQTEVYNGNPASPASQLRTLNAVGGWTQLKLKPWTKLEFNVAAGQDNVLAYDLRWAPQLFGEYQTVFARNRAAFVNTVYRPKSNLLFSVEYRKIWTYSYTGAGNRADQVNVAAGVSF
jgi:hypothetical protein